MDRKEDRKEFECFVQASNLKDKENIREKLRMEVGSLKVGRGNDG